MDVKKFCLATIGAMRFYACSFNWGYTLFYFLTIRSYKMSMDLNLIPGNEGNDCPMNGTHIDENGEIIECECDECDFMMCCMANFDYQLCENCFYNECPYHCRGDSRIARVVGYKS